jgi:hypothetical protein
MDIRYGCGMTNNKVVRVATGANGKVSAVDMVIALAKSGCPLEGTKLYVDMSEADRATVRAALEEA